MRKKAKKKLIRFLIIDLAILIITVSVGRFALRLVVKPVARIIVMGTTESCFASDGGPLTIDDFNVPVSAKFVDAYNLFLKLYFPKEDKEGKVIGEYTFQGDVLLALQKIANQEMTSANEWEVLTSQVLIAIGYLADSSIHNAYLEAKKALNLAQIASITKDLELTTTLYNAVGDIESGTMGTAGVLSLINSIDDNLGSDSGIIPELALLSDGMDEEDFNGLQVKGRIETDEKRTVQLTYPNDASEVYAPITFKGKVYGDAVKYWIQYWKDVDGDGVATDTDTDSSWLTVVKVEVGTAKSMRERIISPIEAGTIAMFLANTFYIARIYSVDSEGNPSANPNVNHMSGIGDRENYDWVMHVLDRDLSAPPSPITGRYIVKSPGSGAWAGHDNDIADGSTGSWVFTTVVENMVCNCQDEDKIPLYFDGSNWSKLLLWEPCMVNAFKVKAEKKPPWWLFW